MSRGVWLGLDAVLQALVFPALWPAYAEAQARGDIAVDTADLRSHDANDHRVERGLGDVSHCFWSCRYSIVGRACCRTAAFASPG